MAKNVESFEYETDLNRDDMNEGLVNDRRRAGESPTNSSSHFTVNVPSSTAMYSDFSLLVRGNELMFRPSATGSAFQKNVTRDRVMSAQDFIRTDVYDDGGDGFSRTRTMTNVEANRNVLKQYIPHDNESFGFHW